MDDKVTVKTNAIKPMLMQLAEPEYMCTKCGAKFFVKDKNNPPEHCEYCKINFNWK